MYVHVCMRALVCACVEVRIEQNINHFLYHALIIPLRKESGPGPGIWVFWARLGVNKCQEVFCADLKSGITGVCETFRILCECWSTNSHSYDCIVRVLNQQTVFQA